MLRVDEAIEAKKRRESEDESQAPFVEMAPPPVECDVSVGSSQHSEFSAQPVEEHLGECLGASDSDDRQGPLTEKLAKPGPRYLQRRGGVEFVIFYGFDLNKLVEWRIVPSIHGWNRLNESGVCNGNY